MKNIRKLFNTDIKSLDEDARTVEVVFSTEDKDRDGEVVVQAGWDFEDYSKNPVILWGHNPNEPPVGKALDLRVEGDRSIAKIQFAKGDSVSERLFNLVKQGILKTVSAGFINTLYEDNKLLENKLLEISFVSIPANQNAITLAYESGMISKDDTSFLMKSYRKQLEYLETAEHKAWEVNAKTGEETYLYMEKCYCEKCKDVRGKLEAGAILINKEGETMEKQDIVELVAEQVGEQLKPLSEKIDNLSEAMKQEPSEDAKPKQEQERSEEESDTKPANEPGSTDDEEAEEELSPEEVGATIAEALEEVA